MKMERSVNFFTLTHSALFMDTLPYIMSMEKKLADSTLSKSQIFGRSSIYKKHQLLVHMYAQHAFRKTLF